MKYKEKTNDYWVFARLTDDIEYHSTPPSHMIVYFFNGKTVFQARRISNLPKEYPDTTSMQPTRSTSAGSIIHS